jgi:hypothetical protein
VRELDGISYATGKNTLGAHLQHAYLSVVTGKDKRYADWLTAV